jgi:hypothetical protein
MRPGESTGSGPEATPVRRAEARRRPSSLLRRRAPERRPGRWGEKTTVAVHWAPEVNDWPGEQVPGSATLKSAVGIPWVTARGAEEVPEAVRVRVTATGVVVWPTAVAGKLLIAWELAGADARKASSARTTKRGPRGERTSRLSAQDGWTLAVDRGHPTRKLLCFYVHLKCFKALLR